jgi:hypothetical protein
MSITHLRHLLNHMALTFAYVFKFSLIEELTYEIGVDFKKQ